LFDAVGQVLVRFFVSKLFVGKMSSELEGGAVRTARIDWNNYLDRKKLTEHNE
jgi:hypothetical protein